MEIDGMGGGGTSVRNEYGNEYFRIGDEVG